MNELNPGDEITTNTSRRGSAPQTRTQPFGRPAAGRLRASWKRILAVPVAAALAIGGAVGVVNGASALSENVAFSAVELPTWQADGIVYALGSAAGKVVAGGTFGSLKPPAGSSAAAKSVSALAILDAETGNPASCQIPVTLAGGTATVRAIVASPDQRTVYLAGNFSNVGGRSVSRVAAIDVVSCSTLPLTVNSVSSTVYGLALHGNTLYLAGQFATVSGQPRARFAAVNASTGAVLPFVADADAPGRAIAVSPDGTKVALGGDINTVNGQDSHSIAIVDAVTGANIKTYPGGFLPPTSVTKAIWSASDGNFYVGNEGTGGGVFDGRFAVNWDTGEQVWRDACLGATQAVLEYQGTLYSASHAHDCNANNAFQDGKRNYFMAQKTSDAKILGWFPAANDGIGEGIGPRALTIARGATSGEEFLWSGGEFTRINGQVQQGLTRFGRTNSALPSSSAPIAQAMADGSIQVRARTAVDNDDDTLTYRIYRDGAATPVWESRAYSMWWYRPQVTFVDSDVAPGSTHRYVLEVSDGTHTLRSAQVSAKALGAAANYETTVRNDRPDFQWRSSLAGTWVQDSGRRSSGTAQSARAENGPTPSADGAVSGDVTGSLSYDGVNDYLWEDDYRSAPNVYTAELWFKTTTTSGGKLIGFGNGRPRTDNGNAVLSGNYDRHVYMGNDGRLHFGVWTGGAQLINSAKAYNDGQWHHVVASQGPDGLAMYVDASLIGTNPATAGQPYYGVWHVGGDSLGGWPEQPASAYFAGQIDEVSVYPSVLNRRQVTGHYQSGGGVPNINTTPSDAFGAQAFNDDPSLYWRLGEANRGTVKDSSYYGESTGAYGADVTLGAPGIDGAGTDTAAVMPGSNDQITAQTAPAAPPRTFTNEIWFNTTTGGGKLFGFENVTAGDGNSYDKQLYMGNDGRLRFGTYVGWTSVVTSPLPYNDGAWHQAVTQVSEAGTKLFVDGRLVAQNGTTTAETGSGYWRVGGGNLGGWPDSPSSYRFRGSLDEFLVYPSALSDAQIRKHYLLGVDDTAAPSTPTQVTVTAGQPVRLAWSASTDDVGVASYRVYRAKSADFTPGAATLIGESTETTFADATQLDAATYYYKVVAIDETGNASAASDAVTLNQPDVTGPTKPLGMAATVSSGTVELKWLAATDDVGVTGYAVYRGASADFAPAPENLLAEVSGRSYTDPDRPVGYHYYKVVALDAAGNRSAASDAAEARVPDATAPSTVSGLSAKVVDNRIALAWAAATDDTGVTGYLVFRGAKADFDASETSLVARTTDLAWTDPEAKPGEYFYRVAATDAAGNVGVASTSVVASVADTTAPSVPSDLIALAGQHSATLRWGAATDDVGVVTYRIYRSTAGANVPVDADNLVAEVEGTTWVDPDLALETYHYVVTAVDAAGNQGAASASASVNVSDGTSPDAPTGLAAQVVDAKVNLSWSAASGGVPAARYAIYSGTSADFEPTETTQVGTSTGTSWTHASPGTGERYYKVVAFSASGVRSRPTDAIKVVLADTAAPTVPGSVTASVNGTAVSLGWQASTDDTAVTGYRVYRGTTADFTVGQSTLQASPTGTSWTTPTHPYGTFYYKVVAVDAAGNASAATPARTVTVADPNPQTTEVRLEAAEDAAAYSTAAGTNYGSDSQLWAKGTPGQQSFLRFNLPAAPVGKQLTAASLSLRTSTDPAANTTEKYSFDVVTGSWSESSLTWNNRPTDVSGTVGTSEAVSGLNTPFSVKLDAGALANRPGSALSLRMRGPSTGTDNLRIWSSEAPNQGYRPVLILTYGGSGPAPDTEAPTAPSGLTSSVTGSTVTLNWTRSTDNVGVSRYTVHRGTSAGFTPAAGNAVTSSVTSSFSDSGLAAGTYYYKVVASDAAGNVSAASAAAAATVVSDPVVRTVNTTADAPVVEASPGTNYGTSNQLFARGNAAQESFLRFELPQAPSGTRLTKAELVFRTSNDAAAGSTDRFAVDAVSGSWSESGLTWSNRPSTKVATAGTVTGASATNTEQRVALQTEALPAGSALTLRITGSGSDNLRIFSREYAASVTPRLVLTYS